MSYNAADLAHLNLGQKTSYPSHYDNTLLQPVPRALNRAQLGLSDDNLPFRFGADVWNLFELSWLNPNGIPQVAVAEVVIPMESRALIESKSFKLYLNSFNQTVFSDKTALTECLVRDLSACAGGEVAVKVFDLRDCPQAIGRLSGENIDDQPITIRDYQFNADYLEGIAEGEWTEETLVSDLLKSNCLITQQPDWGSVQIHYVGKRLNREKLLRYIVSFREHNEFHEQCVERIFCDLMRYAAPEKLTVYARYTRRGGLDINPFRSNFETLPENLRLARQ